MTDEEMIHMVMLAPGYREEVGEALPGSIRTTADCTHSAWISKTMRANIKRWDEEGQKSKTICEDCAMKNEELTDSMMENGVYMTTSSAAELKAAGQDPATETNERGLALHIEDNPAEALKVFRAAG